MNKNLSRRDFIKLTALGATGVVAGGLSIPLLMNEKEASFDPNDSFWAKEQKWVNPSINGDLQVDVAIIGGGYTGLSTAYHLARSNPDLDIVVFEAKQVGHGASGRNGGMVLPQTGLESLQIAEDEKTHKLTYDITVNSMKELENLVNSTGIECDLQLDGYCYAIVDEEDLSYDLAYVEQVQKLGMPLEFWDEKRTYEELGNELYCGAIYDPNGGQVHAMKLVKTLKKAAENLGVIIYENSQVKEIKEDQSIHLKVGETDSIVIADSVVLATNGYTSKLGYFKNQILPIHAQCAVTPPLHEQDIENMGWNSRLPFFDSRNFLYHLVLTADNRIVIGGGYAEYYLCNDLHFNGDLKQIGRMLKTELTRMYPILKGIQFDYVWDGILGMTYNEIESVGVMGKNKNIYFGLGYNGHGINTAFLFGNVIASLYNNKVHDWDKTAYHDEPLAQIPPEPIKWLGIQGYLSYYHWMDQQ